jgi:hypothetical protein
LYIFSSIFALFLPHTLSVLKRSLLILIALLFSFCANSQNLYLTIEGETAIETSAIDSLSYKKTHPNAKSVEEEALLTLGTVIRNGYLEATIINFAKVNDSTFNYSFSLRKKTKAIHIYTGKLTEEEKNILNINKDTITLPLRETEAFMNNNIVNLERNGYSLSSLQLTDYSQNGNILHATLTLKSEKQRTLDGLVIEGYDKFPEGIKRNILKQYKGKTFNQDKLQRIYNDFNSLRFVSQTRYPEILFTKDSTKVYVYLEKSKANSFDGFVGFGNDEQSKIIFTGYVDLSLNNVLNTGEKFNLYWKSDGHEQTTFNTSIELPYIFRSPVGVKALLRIFKQDSTFQNTVTDINVGYYFSYNSKLYLGHQKTQSVDIRNLNTSTLADFSNSFWTSSYEYTAYATDDFLFPEKTFLFIKGGIGKRDSKTESTNQYFIQLNAGHNLYLNKKNMISLRNQSYYLKSNSYIINELFRFGGINSVRGFNENSLQANFVSAILAEYRYMPAPNIYIHSVTDYAHFQDLTSNVNENLIGLGFGFGILTKNGRFNIMYANGSTQNQQIKLSNSIVHISYKASF